MKRSALVLLSLLLGLFLCACALGRHTIVSTRSEQTSSTRAAETTSKESIVQTTRKPTTQVTGTSKITTTTTLLATSTGSSTSATEATTATTSAQAEGPRMYSSYAFLVSFDPESNIAKFDYFDMLNGKEAVEFLVKHEGLSQKEAEDLVENFADSEFVLSNLNDQLREIDLTEVSLSLMYHTSGEMTEIWPVPATLSDFKLIYELDPLLLTDSFFFFIEVAESGKVILVEQVYWP